MNIDEQQVERIVRLVIGREEHYRWNEHDRPDGAIPLTQDHVFGRHVLVMEDRKVPLSPHSAAHLEQRVRAITASTLAALKDDQTTLKSR